MLQIFHFLDQSSHSLTYPRLEDIQGFLDGSTGLQLSPIPTPNFGPTHAPRVAPPFETSEGSDMTDMGRQSKVTIEEGEVKSMASIDGVEVDGQLHEAPQVNGNFGHGKEVEGQSHEASQVNGVLSHDKEVEVGDQVTKPEKMVEPTPNKGDTSVAAQEAEPQDAVTGVAVAGSTMEVEGDVPAIEINGVEAEKSVETSGHGSPYKGVIISTASQVSTPVDILRDSEVSSVEVNGCHTTDQTNELLQAPPSPHGEATHPPSGMYTSKHVPQPPQHPTPKGGRFIQKYADIPRAPRDNYQPRHPGPRYPPNPQHNGQQFGTRPNGQRSEPRYAEVEHIKKILEDERKAHKVALEQAEARVRHDYEAALQQITSHVLGQRVQLSRTTVHLRQKELDLDARETLNRKVEHLLAIGQKILATEDDQDNETYKDVVEKIIEQRVVHELKCRDRAVEAQLAEKREELKFREAATDMREKAYTAMVKASTDREKLKADIKAKLEHEITLRISEAEYDRGFSEGRTVGKTERNAEIRCKSYDEGFAACHAMHDSLKRFRAGELTRDSPEMAFLLDENHISDLFRYGLQAGRRSKVPQAPQAHIQPDLKDKSPAPIVRPAELPTRVVPTSTDPNEVAPLLSKPHPYAHLNGRANRANGTQARTPGPQRRPRETNGFRHFRDVWTPNGPGGVPKYGPRTAPPAIHPSLQTPSPTLPTFSSSSGNLIDIGTSGIATTISVNDSTTSTRPSTAEDPASLSGKRLVSTKRQVFEDQKVHEEDQQVDLIDFYDD